MKKMILQLIMMIIFLEQNEAGGSYWCQMAPNTEICGDQVVTGCIGKATYRWLYTINKLPYGYAYMSPGHFSNDNYLDHGLCNRRKDFQLKLKSYQCEDTANWDDGHINSENSLKMTGCADYRKNNFCKNCQVSDGWDTNEWEKISEYKNPIANCRLSCGCCGQILEARSTPLGRFVKYDVKDFNTNGCIQYLTATQCEQYAKDTPKLTWGIKETEPEWPKGCYYGHTNEANFVFFNDHETGGTKSLFAPVCINTRPPTSIFDFYYGYDEAFEFRANDPSLGVHSPDKSYIWVLSPANNLYVTTHRGKWKSVILQGQEFGSYLDNMHSYFLNGGPILVGGELNIEGGVPIFDNASGHYKPCLTCMKHLIVFFRDKMKISDKMMKTWIVRGKTVQNWGQGVVQVPDQTFAQFMRRRMAESVQPEKNKSEL